MPRSEHAWLRSDWGIATAIFFGTVLLQIPFRLRWASLLDEGLILQIADDLRHGHRPYVDAVHVVLPGVFYLTAAAFSLFGTSIETARALAAALFAVLTSTAYLIARWWLSRGAALAVAVIFVMYRVWAFPHWQMVSYSTLAVVLALVTTWVLGEALGSGNLWTFLVAGMVAGAAIVAKQDSGGATAVALSAAILLSRPDAPGTRRGRLISFCAGIAVVLVALVVVAWRSGFAREMFEQAVLSPWYNASYINYPRRPALWPLLRQDEALRGNFFSYFPSILVDLHWWAIAQSWLYLRTPVVDAVVKLVYHLPWMLLVVVGIPVAYKLRSASDDVRLQRQMLLVLLALGFLLAFNRPHDWVHLLVLYPPTLLLGTILWSWCGRLRLMQILAWMGIPLLVGTSSILALEFRQQYSSPVRTVRGTLYVRAPQAAALTGVLDALARAPATARLAALPYHPLLNFLSARRGVTRFYYVWPVEHNHDRDTEVVRGLEADPTALVVYGSTLAPHFPRVSEYADHLFRYLATHFSIERTFGAEWGAFTFFVLQPAPGVAGQSLLGESVSAAQVALRDVGAPAQEVLPADRSKLMREALWPFHPVVEMAGVPGHTVILAYQIKPAAGQLFHTSYAVNPDRWGDVFVPAVRFAVSVRDETDEHTLVDVALDVQHNPSDRRWQDAEIDLSPWAGRSIELRLEVSIAADATPQPALAGWGDPTLVDSRHG